MSIICMTDIETLSTARNAVIVQVGMVVAKVSKKDGTGEILNTFNVYLDWKKQLNSEKCNRVLDPDTLEWWIKQPDSTMKNVFGYEDKDRIGLLKALSLINVFLREYEIREFWSKGNFDYPILEDAFKQYRLDICPWKYGQIREFRTLLKFAQDKGFSPVENVGHNALEDAKAQLDDLIRIYKFFL